MTKRSLAAIVSCVAVLAVQGCSSDGMGSGIDLGGGFDGGGGNYNICNGAKGVLTYVWVTPPSEERYTQLGDSVTYLGRAGDGTCSFIPMDFMASWSSSTPAIFPISPLKPAGEFATAHAIGLGNAAVQLSKSGISDIRYTTIIPRVAEVKLEPASATIRTGDSLYVALTVTDTAGNVLPDIEVRYSFDSTYAVALVGHDAWRGVWLYGNTPGTRTFTAKLFGLTGRSEITVVAR